MDRSIPHVRDIFSNGGNDICTYQYSPGRRRRKNLDTSPQDFIDVDHSDSNDEQFVTKQHRHNKENPPRSSKPSRENQRNNLQNNFQFMMTKDDRRLEDQEMGHGKQKSGHYSSRTLTEKDIKHLERHLSMKKTIRKQISRNLAQAFVDDPLILAPSNHPANEIKPPPSSSGRSFTLTKAKVAKSEQNFLDMLKKECREDTDSGHSSPTYTASSCDEDSIHSAGEEYQPPKSSQSRGSYDLMSGSGHQVPPSTSSESSGRFSIWKIFKGKTKR